MQTVSGCWQHAVWSGYIGISSGAVEFFWAKMDRPPYRKNGPSDQVIKWAAYEDHTGKILSVCKVTKHGMGDHG